MPPDSLGSLNTRALLRAWCRVLLLGASAALLALPHPHRSRSDDQLLGAHLSEESQSVYTFASQSLGAAAADRIIFLTVQAESVAADNVTATIAGVTATKVASDRDAAGGIYIAIYWTYVPTGTTGTIEVTVPENGDLVHINTHRATGIGTSPTASSGLCLLMYDRNGEANHIRDDQILRRISLYRGV